MTCEYEFGNDKTAFRDAYRMLLQSAIRAKTQEERPVADAVKPSLADDTGEKRDDARQRGR